MRTTSAELLKSIGICRLREDILDHLAVHVGQAEVAAGITVGKSRMIHAELIQECRVEIVDRYAVLNCLEAEFVGSTIGEAAFEAPAGDPHGETVGVVVAAVPAFGD